MSIADSDGEEPKGRTVHRSSSDTRRWVGVGRADGDDARGAGRRAATDAIGGRDASLLLAFASDAFDLGELVGGIRSAAPRVPLIGCSTAGEIHAGGAGDHSVVVTALGGPGFQVSTAVARDAPADLYAAGARAAGAASAIGDAPHQVLVLLSDGLAGDQQEVVRGAYAQLGARVPLVGGCAGDDLRMRRTHQFYDDEVLTGAVVSAAIGSDGALGIGVEHGWRSVGEPLLVTASRDSRVFRLDDRPALDAYLEAAGAPDQVRTDPAAFTRFAITHPLGLRRRNGTEVRFIGGADFDQRSLVCIAEVPQGELAHVMEGDQDSVLAATDAACQAARSRLGGHEPIGLVAFDCIARRGVLGEDRLVSEIQRVRASFPGAPLAGFYTYGEFARTEGVRGFHNQTLVLLAVS